MTSKKLSLVASALAPIACSATAFAGDYAAHAKATNEAIAEVKKMPEFAGGVAGSPDYPLMDGYIGNTDAELEQDFVNHPDQWACQETTFYEVPPRLQRILLDKGPNQFFMTRLLGSFGNCALAMACNYTHFVKNEADPDLLTADAAARITSDWAHEIIDYNVDLGINGPTRPYQESKPYSWQQYRMGFGYCTAATWNVYWGRVLKSLHFVQDQQSEDHQIGNVHCAAWDFIPPLSAVGILFGVHQFGRCDSWLLDMWGMMNESSCLKSLKCDGAVYSYDSKGCSSPSLTTKAIWQGCMNGGITAACMGLERLIYHHCNYGQHKSFECRMPQQDNCSADHDFGYCEGEVCPECGKKDCPGQGGESFVLKAKEASIPKIIEAARAWADVCRKPTTCTPKECQSWCWKTLPTQDPEYNAVFGDCVTKTDGSCECSCTLGGFREKRAPKSCEAVAMDAGAPDATGGVDCRSCAPTNFDARFDRPNYLNHIIRDGGASYMLYVEPPDEKGVLRVADGFGGTIPYATDYHSGPLNTPRDVCNAAASQGVKPQEWTPYNRTNYFDCKCMSCGAAKP